MELSFAIARDGHPTCAAGGLWLHSRYEPSSEALRFARAAIGQTRPAYVVILGSCLGYLAAAARELLPGSRIVAVQYSSAFEGRTVATSDASWNPAAGLGLDSFLDAALDEDAISGVAVLEWEPAARAFPAEAAEAKAALRDSLDRLASSASTVKASGKRWVANACASFLLAERVCALEPARLPALVAAAGPSLRSSLLELRAARGDFTLISVSSALAACLAAGVEPDLVVATDGGYWSRPHLYPLASTAIPLAAPLTALPSACLYSSLPLALLDQGSFVEADLLAALGPEASAIRLPAHGTVSGTAIHLASALTSAPIFVAGLDLASLGELEHARPHAFDALFEAKSCRAQPAEGERWSRALGSCPDELPDAPWRSSRSLAAYASALSMDAAALPGRLYRIAPSPVGLQGFEPSSPREAARIAGCWASGLGPSRGGAGLRLRGSALPSARERKAMLASRIASWRRRAAEACCALSRGALPADEAVGELLRSIDIVDYAAARRAALARAEPGPAALDLARRSEEFLSGLERRFTR